MRYATKSIMLDGKQYNAGDIVPYNLRNDEETAKNYTRDEGQSKPGKASPKAAPKKGGTPKDVGLSSKNTPARTRRQYRRRQAK